MALIGFNVEPYNLWRDSDSDRIEKHSFDSMAVPSLDARLWFLFDINTVFLSGHHIYKQPTANIQLASVNVARETMCNP